MFHDSNFFLKYFLHLLHCIAFYTYFIWIIYRLICICHVCWNNFKINNTMENISKKNTQCFFGSTFNISNKTFKIRNLNLWPFFPVITYLKGMDIKDFVDIAILKYDHWPHFFNVLSLCKCPFFYYICLNPCTLNK